MVMDQHRHQPPLTCFWNRPLQPNGTILLIKRRFRLVILSLSQANGELKVVWPFIDGAEEYELEWTWINGLFGRIIRILASLINNKPG